MTVGGAIGRTGNGPRRLSRTGLVVLACSALALIAGGLVVYRTGVLAGAPEAPAVRPAVAKPSRPAVPGVRAVPVPRQVLTPVDAGPRVRRPRLTAAVAAPLADPDLGPHVGFAVDDLASGRKLLRVGARDRFVPASLTKLFTATAALQTLTPDHRFTTEVVALRHSRRIVLVGGGDPLLSRRPAPGRDYPATASLAQLAKRTAAALLADGISEVRLDLDASLFSGPAMSPHWRASYRREDVVSPITALWVDQGRVASGAAQRSTDPVRAAGKSFVRQLLRHGVDVRGNPRELPAPSDAVEIASVRSAPLARIYEQVLGASDNEAAEVLLRHVGLAQGKPGAFGGGAAALREVLRSLGVDFSGVRLVDGSGLSRHNRLTVQAVLDVLAVAAAPGRERLRPVLVELPVAGFSGSLGYRFTDASAARGRGFVRAKTGTLTGVHAMAGLVESRSGALLSFVAIADRVRRIDTLDARAALDRVGAALAGCRC